MSPRRAQEPLAALVVRAQGDQQALDQAVRRLTPLVHKVMRRYRQPGVEADDLLQAGRIGVMRGVQEWRPDRGANPLTFIAAGVRMFVAAAARRARLPFAVELDIDAPLDQRRGEEGSTWAEVLADDDVDVLAEASSLERRTALHAALERLPLRQAYVARCRLRGERLQEIADRLRCSREHARQVLAAATANLRRALVRGLRVRRAVKGSGHRSASPRRCPRCDAAVRPCGGGAMRALRPCHRGPTGW